MPPLPIQSLKFYQNKSSFKHKVNLGNYQYLDFRAQLL